MLHAHRAVCSHALLAKNNFADWKSNPACQSNCTLDSLFRPYIDLQEA